MKLNTVRSNRGINMNNFQREGASSNTSVGNKFEVKAERFFRKQGFQF